MFYKPCDPLVLALPPGQGYLNAVQFVTGHFSNCRYPWWGLKQYADNSPEHLAAINALTKRVTYQFHQTEMHRRWLVLQLQQHPASACSYEAPPEPHASLPVPLHDERFLHPAYWLDRARRRT
jgi:hypothetical protein